ncbi:ubiquinol-cytochrome c reductase complex assembly factor 2 isoform X1 [Macaca nemestrina]|uniref:ubiquinol-cytochrome c reductase complex assembly factor 2 isoform X1 n=1 Tax=Macaca nemestrina TaxID=9545 RepID=UPI0039B8FC37
MAASRYRRFLKLCEEWPVDETKRGRDLGAYLRQRVAQAFREGENTQVAEPEACDQMYESLARLHSNYYKHKTPWKSLRKWIKACGRNCRRSFPPRVLRRIIRPELRPYLAHVSRCGVLYIAIVNKTAPVSP